MNGTSVKIDAIFSPSLRLAASEFVYEYSESMRVANEVALLEEEHSLAAEIYTLYNRSQNLIERFVGGEELLTCKGVRVRLSDESVIILRLKNRLPFPMDFSYIDLSSIGGEVEFTIRDLMSRCRMNRSYQVDAVFVRLVSEIADGSPNLASFYNLVTRLNQTAGRTVQRIKAQKEMTLAALKRREPIL